LSKNENMYVPIIIDDIQAKWFAWHCKKIGTSPCLHRLLVLNPTHLIEMSVSDRVQEVYWGPHSILIQQNCLNLWIQDFHSKIRLSSSSCIHCSSRLMAMSHCTAGDLNIASQLLTGKFYFDWLQDSCGWFWNVAIDQ
jgi:hypothetical protein